ncbi:protein kinase [Nocardia sp. NPDC050710]|uniref:serine/threonine-protein kinase n=1 Tax=Nocardia sp. NPDC050710 TaxID=3157220 RepID=UPI0033D43DBE
MVEDGSVFAGYSIERRLGHGGMGTVYLARHPRLPRWTAMKLLNPAMFSDKEIRARFEREADLVAQLEHPNIVTVFDRGVEDDQLWISMQYIDGVDAASVDPHALPAARATQIIVETAKALDFAHSMGVLHRDVKPANILLAKSTGGQERVYLTDFGIARLRDDAGHLTQTGTFNATLAYASPEQLTGAAMDGRSDQYSLACTLYWLLVGAAPFESTHPAAVIQGHLQQYPPPLTSRRAGLPAALDRVLVRAMAKRPEERFASCVEFAEAARQALAGIPPQGMGGAPVPGPITPAQPMAQMGGYQAPQQLHPTPAQPAPQQMPLGSAPHGGYGYPVGAPRPRSNRGLMVTLCAALVVVIAVGVGIWAANSGGKEDEGPRRDLAEMQQGFPRLLPQSALESEGKYGSGTGFSGIGCGGEVLEKEWQLTWLDGPHPEVGKPTAKWDCNFTNSYMIPASKTRWPQLRIFRYDSAEEVKKVTAAFLGASTRTDANGARVYTNYAWGTDPETTPRMVTVFNEPEREKCILYTYGLGASNDPSINQLVDFWKTMPLN